MDQTLQRDAPPRVLVLVCNLEGGWQRHEGLRVFLLLPGPCICYAFLWTTLSWWTTTLGGLREGHTHSLTHLFMSISSFLIYYQCDSSLHPVTYFLRLWWTWQISWMKKHCEKPSSRQFSGVKLVFSLCVSSRSHGLHGAWQRAARCIYGEKNGPAKLCKGRSDPQTNQLEEKTPTAPSFPQGAHAVLEQGEFVFNWPLTRLCWRNAATNP